MTSKHTNTLRNMQVKQGVHIDILMFKSFLSICLFILSLTPLSAQNDQVELLNKIVQVLQGEQKNPNIPVFRSINEACASTYIRCNRNKQITFLDFQYTNLIGRIPKEITQLSHLKNISLDKNYLKGPIPEHAVYLVSFRFEDNITPPVKYI